MVVVAFLLTALSAGDLADARDRQDKAALERAASEASAAVLKQAGDATAQYRMALVQSYIAEVAMEQRDKPLAKNAAEIGIKAAERAVALKPDVAEHHRILGTLCGQVIPANVMSGLKYGRCAQESINKAIELDPKSAIAYVSRGVGHYYLPPMFGGGANVAVQDFQKAIKLNPKLAEAHLWLGIALRKANRNDEAKKAIGKSLDLNPNRVWAKQQFDKTSPH
jgi:tetratricopeptide (TPR) repeat protein